MATFFFFERHKKKELSRYNINRNQLGKKKETKQRYTKSELVIYKLRKPFILKLKLLEPEGKPCIEENRFVASDINPTKNNRRRGVSHHLRYNKKKRKSKKNLEKIGLPKLSDVSM